MRLVGLQRALARVGLPAWFLATDVLWVADLRVIGIDARHYQRAASEWLAGGNPWAVVESGITYAAGPHTLLQYAPTSLLPLGISVVIWMGIGLAAAVWVVTRLGLPIWWVAFPPLAHAIWNGNPQTLVVALLVAAAPTIGESGREWPRALAGAAATFVKLYAALPLIVRPRQLIVAGGALALALPLLPWQLYLEMGLGVQGHLAESWNGSAWRFPLLIPPTLVALWALRRHGAEWYSIPAVWPATQYYYISTVLPAIAGRPVLAALIALPLPLMVPVVVIALAVREATRRTESVRRLEERFNGLRVAWRRRIDASAGSDS